MTATTSVSYADSIEMSAMSVTPRGARSEVGIDISTENFGPADIPSNAQQLPPVDGGWQAWMFCLCSFFLETLVWGFGFSYGVFQSYYSTHAPFQNQSKIAIAAVGPIALAIEYGEGILLSFIYGKYPELLKPSMWFGLALAVTSLLVSSFVDRVELLILLQGVCLGIGSGMMYWPTMFLISEWFSRRRGLASGIVFAGSGVGGFLFPLIVNGLLDAVDFRWTLRIFAAIMAVLGCLGVLGTRRRIPISKYRPGQQRPKFIPRNMQFFKSPIFWLFSLCNLLQALSFFPVSLFIADFTKSFSSPLSATIVLSLFNVSGVISQIIIGYLTDKMPYTYIMVVTMFASALSAFLIWGFADTLGTMFAFAIIFGAVGGGFASVTFPASADAAGANPEQTSMALSATMVFKGFAAAIGPVASGVLLEAGRNLSFGGKYGKFGFGAVEIFVGSWVTLKKINWSDPEGKERVWESAERTTRGPSGIDAVAVFAILRSETDAFPISTVIIEQYRPPVGKFVVEMPAGLIDKGETAEEAAIRELEEETGYQAKKVLQSSPVLVADPGMSNANMKLVTVDVPFPDELETYNQKLDAGEFITKRVVEIAKLTEEFEKYEEKGYVIDAKLSHFAAGYAMALRLQEHQL
ncbi:hypothetical protein EIP91_012166 [Steccherinum ochraceum]|uniref:Major facilitator superfamily (MFS) profile domain-containing protein n=1 Tax=Steccherinum ochraceum TaxID=92696 RepID=A0A4R0RJI4_9APHY|nr:hypothetical protein EIP91_012166 [Steccherinum ochraceum]